MPDRRSDPAHPTPSTPTPASRDDLAAPSSEDRREAARARHQAPDPVRDRDGRTGGSAARQRITHQAQWVDQQIRIAMERGDFDNLPGAGKPIRDLGKTHDPDWWVKRLVERERITGLLPPSLQLRKDDAALDDLLDTHPWEAEARREIEEFNSRVIAARYSLQAGPPLITMPRDVEETLAAWRERRDVRRRRQSEQVRAAREADARAEQERRSASKAARARRWWRRSS